MELVADARAASFEAFVAPHLPAMWRLAGRLVGFGEREDVYQDALLAAWSRWATYDPARGSPLTWLLVLVADRSRKAGRRRRPTAPLVDVAAAEPDRDLHLDVSAAVAALPRRQRLAVELFYVLDLPVADTAAVMGCSVGTVSSTLSDARRALRRRLEAP